MGWSDPGFWTLRVKLRHHPQVADDRPGACSLIRFDDLMPATPEWANAERLSLAHSWTT
jgi:hypothetical protein